MTETHNNNTKRIAQNTMYLYGRMLIGMLVSLYTSRVILNALGIVDYGIQNVVGGLVSMFSLVSSALSSSISRFITFELGTRDESKLRQVFSTSLLIQLVIGLIVIIVAETVGLWFLNNRMVIPTDRIYAANWVYQASILSFVLGLLGCPYNALLVAYEKMNIFAYLGILNILLNLCIVLFIAYTTVITDKLIVYSFLLVTVGIIMQMIYLLYCRKHFPESHERPHFHKQCWKEMSRFATWNAIGCSAAILKDQGVNVLINLFYGPTINAARGVAMAVNGAVSSFAGNFMTAVNPQITKSYACGDNSYLFMLVERSSRFGFYVMLCLALPILLESEFILSVWLGNYPDFSVIFVRFVLLCSLLEILSNSLIVLQNATGNIRNYQLGVGGLLLMNFPISWIALKLGAAPYFVYIIAFVIGVGCLILRLSFLGRMTGLSIRAYIINVIFNVFFTAIAACIVPIVIYMIMPDGLLRFITVTVTGVASAAASSLFIGCTATERRFLIDRMVLISNRLCITR